MKLRKIIIILLTLCTLLLFEGIVMAAERITNGTFEGGVSGWEGMDGTIVRATMSVHSGSDSAEVSNTSAYPTQSIAGAAQCVDIPTSDSEDTFTAKAWIYVPDDVPEIFEAAYIGVNYYATDDCTDGVGPVYDSSHITTTGSWQEVTSIAPVPGVAESARVWLYVRKTDNTANPHVFFDDVTFYDSTVTAVTVSRIASTSPFLNLAAMFVVSAGFVILRKRR